MQIAEFRVEAFRSIREAALPLGPFASLIGANNSGKTNLLVALQAFFGDKDLSPEDFWQGRTDRNIILEARFSELTEAESGTLGAHMWNGELWVRRVAQWDGERDRLAWDTFSLTREPKNPDLKRSGLGVNKGRLTDIVTAMGLPTYFRGPSGRVSQASFLGGLERYYIEESERIEWDAPSWSPDPNLWRALRASLPRFHYVPAVRDLSQELGSRTHLSELLEDLVARLLESSRRLGGLKRELARVRRLVTRRGGRDDRLPEIKAFEQRITAALAEGMPNVSVELEFEPLVIEDLFSQGSRVYVNDGIRTDARSKGHGLQRELMIAILRVYAEYAEREGVERRPRIFAIEEPELYLHPQAQRRLYEVLERLSGEDQIILCTHSALFVDVAEYQRIRIVSKTSVEEGTQVFHVAVDLFPGDEKAEFRLAVAYDSDRSELFFARKVLLVEGEADWVAFAEIAAKLGIDLGRRGISIVEVGGKSNLPHFMRVLGAFQIPHVAAYDVDPDREDSPGLNEKIRGAVVPPFGAAFEIDPNMDVILGVTNSQVKRWGKVYATHLRLGGMAPAEIPVRCVEGLRALTGS